jgi:hypothetical protein
MIAIAKSRNRVFSRQHRHCGLILRISHFLFQILYRQRLLPGGVDVGDGLVTHGTEEGSF